MNELFVSIRSPELARRQLATIEYRIELRVYVLAEGAVYQDIVHKDFFP